MIASLDGRQFREVIRPGAFSQALQNREHDVAAFYSHDKSRLLGRTKSGTLALAEDSKGLRFSLSLPETQLGNEVRELVRRGDLDSCSFGWIQQRDKWTRGADGVPTCELLAVDLLEVSLVCWPQYTATSVSLREKKFATSNLYRFKLRLRELQGFTGGT